MPTGLLSDLHTEEVDSPQLSQSLGGPGKPPSQQMDIVEQHTTSVVPRLSPSQCLHVLSTNSYMHMYIHVIQAPESIL